jgi:hypothetical protein
MRIQMLKIWSPGKGRMLQAGQIVDDIPDEVAVDLITRGLAKPVKTEAERAISPGQR